MQHFSRNCRVKNLDGLERDEADTYLCVESMTFKCEGERNDHTLHCEQMFGNVFESRKSKYCVVLTKYIRKVKGEQVITLQMAQQLKIKNINFCQDNYFAISVKLNFC